MGKRYTAFGHIWLYEPFPETASKGRSMAAKSVKAKGYKTKPYSQMHCLFMSLTFYLLYMREKQVCLRLRTICVTVLTCNTMRKESVWWQKPALKGGSLFYILCALQRHIFMPVQPVKFARRPRRGKKRMTGFLPSTRAFQYAMEIICIKLLSTSIIT